MKKADVIRWLQNEQPNIESIILSAADNFIKDKEATVNFGFDLSKSQDEGYNLMNGKDLCYDRYTVPLSYSLWYQARRINVFISNFIDKLMEACTSSQPVDVFDLGAGTGCVQLCFGLVVACYQKQNLPVPLVRIINVDSSPFMLDYLKEYIWPNALKFYPEFKNLALEYHVCSWSNSRNLAITNPWICASYLFDSSDNEEYLNLHFEQLIDDFDPQQILVLTSAQDTKKQMLLSIGIKMAAKGYIISNTANSSIFSGHLSNVTQLRKYLVAKYNLHASSSPVSWVDGSFRGLGLSKKQSGFAFRLDIPQQYSLFNMGLKVRRDVRLNELQLKAAEYDSKPTIITGPAGCGKSVVITERIINTLEHFKWAQPLNILVTTFNKSLLKQLRTWLTDLLNNRTKIFRQVYFAGKEDKNDGTGEIVITSPVEIRIKFVHFEMLGKYIGGIWNDAFDEGLHMKKINEFIAKVVHQFGVKNNEDTDVLNPDFILEEYHRVIYGLACRVADGLESYKNLKRDGRVKSLNIRKRELVWHVLNLYVTWMHSDPLAGKSFIARRQLFLNKLNQENDIKKFDYVYVDEFQDCTLADFKIMTKLLKDVNNLIVSGDLAQAVHIGQSGIIPKDEAMRYRRYHRLTGSYRLPYRITEAIYPLSRHISGYSNDKEITLEITPSKGAPPGARPIIVYGDCDLELANKILSIKKCYKVFDVKMITILEEDGALCRAVREKERGVETTTILKLKGLEKELVVWSLQAKIEFENETMEFAYTIMTRTNCMLIIGITPKRLENNLSILKYLNKERLIYWDWQTEQYLKSEKETYMG